MTRPIGSWLLLAGYSVLCLSGCDPSSRAGHVVRDSAGIRIVENARGSWTDDRRWRIADAPSVDIGGGDSAAASLLYRVVTARRLSGGRIAVANTGTSEVRIFDSTGRHLSTIGRRGDGPGEFRSPWHLNQIGDSLVVVDIGRGHRYDVFAPNGELVRSFTTPVATGTEGTELIGWFADGTSLVRRHEYHAPDPQVTTPTRNHVSLFRIGTDGSRLDSLGRFPDQTGIRGRLYLWGPRAHEAVYDSTVYYGPADTYEIHEYSPQGKLRGIIRRSIPNRQTTAQDIAAFEAESRRREAEMGISAQRLAERQRRIGEVQYAPTFPAYYYLKTDDAGNLWVQDYSPHVGEGRVWSVFDRAGVYLGDVEMPERFRLFQIGDDFVLGRWLDADDVEHVRMYPIIKPG